MRFCFFTLLLLGILSIPAAGDEIKGVVRDKEQNDAPLVGANVYWAETTHGTTTDENGSFSIDVHHHGAHPLVVSFVGYYPDTIQLADQEELITVYLEKQSELGEVLIRERQKGQYLSTMDAVQSTKVTASELQKAACCNLSESFETNASVDVSFTDAVTGAKQIKMLGLSGIYVQTIAENMPSVRGMAAPYGLGYVPGPWMESIQISKGTSSVLNGYEAISGQINVEFKKPLGDEILHVNLYGNDALKSEANLNYTYRFNDSLATTFLLHAENHRLEIDDNGDHFLDMPHIQQINLMNRWYQTTPDGGDRQLGVKLLNEHRQSGQVGAFNDLSSGLYGIDIKTRRIELFAKNGVLLPRVGTSFGMQLSGSYHEQIASYGNQFYDGSQYNAYFNLIYQGNFGTDLHTYKTGISFLADAFNEQLDETNYQHREWVPGVYYEYNYHLRNGFNLLAGVRADYSSQFGFFVTPRIHAKWDIRSWLTWRASAGKGYRTAVPLAENNYLLASSRNIVIDDDLQQEEAVNLGTSLIAELQLAGRDLTLMFDYYRTRFINQVIRDVDSSPYEVHFSNLNGSSFSNALQAELIYEVLDGLTLNAAYRINDVQQTVDGRLREVPLNNRYKGLVSLSYATRLDKWQFDFTSQFNGGGRMPDPDQDDPLWSETYGNYTVYNAQITRRFRKWEFYLGGENLGSFTIPQPIIAADDPWSKHFDGSMAWGPVHGRKVYLGLRYTIRSYN